MKPAFTLATTVLLVSSCHTLVDPEAVRNAEVYFPPRFRYVDDPHYCFSAAERERALEECKKRGADTLFEFVIDSEGKVRLTRLVRTNQPPHRHEDLLAHARSMAFSPEVGSDKYRGFYFPTKYTYKSEFEWVQQ